MTNPEPDLPPSDLALGVAFFNAAEAHAFAVHAHTAARTAEMHAHGAYYANQKAARAMVKTAAAQWKIMRETAVTFATATDNMFRNQMDAAQLAAKRSAELLAAAKATKQSTSDRYHADRAARAAAAQADQAAR